MTMVLTKVLSKVADTFMSLHCTAVPKNAAGADTSAVNCVAVRLAFLK